MQDSSTQYSGPMTTADSTQEGRMKVDVRGMKKKFLKKKLKEFKK